MNILNTSVSTLNLQPGNRRILSAENKPFRPERKEERERLPEKDNGFDNAMAQQTRPEPAAEEPKPNRSGSSPAAREGEKTQEAAEPSPAADPASDGEAAEPAVTEKPAAESATQPAVKSGLLPMEEAVIQEQVAKAEAMANQLRPTVIKGVQNAQEIEPVTLNPKGEGIPVEQSESQSAENPSRQTDPVPGTRMNGEQAASASEEAKEGTDLNLLRKAGEKIHGIQPEQTPQEMPQAVVQPPYPSAPIQSTANVGQTAPAWQSTLVNPGEVIDQVRINILQGAQNGQKKVTIQLQPPELGKLNIELSLSDKQIEARIYTEHQTVREVILSQIEQLRSQLSQDGLNLGRIDVSVGTFREADSQQSQNGLLSFRTGRGGSGGNGAEVSAADSTVREWQPPGIGGRVNLIA